MRDTQLKQAENDAAHRRARRARQRAGGQDVAEKNVQTLEEAKARLTQLRKTFELRSRAEAADLRILEIQRDRASNAWQHAQRNAEKMRIVAPLDGLVVLKSIWKSGTMAEVQEGEEVRPGIPILDVVDPSAMRVRVNANQADVEGLARGQTARITLDSYPAKRSTGGWRHCRRSPRPADVHSRADLRRDLLDRRHRRTSAARSRGGRRSHASAGVEQAAGRH